MRPITISLDSGTWELAKKKTNFSQWVRDQLRSERNKGSQMPAMRLHEMSTERIAWELKKRIEAQNHDEAKTRGEEE
jgi:hypothetical protein